MSRNDIEKMKMHLSWHTQDFYLVSYLNNCSKNPVAGYCAKREYQLETGDPKWQISYAVCLRIILNCQAIIKC